MHYSTEVRPIVNPVLPTPLTLTVTPCPDSGVGQVINGTGPAASSVYSIAPSTPFSIESSTPASIAPSTPASIESSTPFSIESRTPFSIVPSTPASNQDGETGKLDTLIHCTGME